MSTLSGFTRPTDPINATDLANLISTALGKTVTAEITPTDILVNGETLSGADQSAVQTAINNYYFGYLQYGAPISDNPTMSVNHGRGVTEAVAYAGDLASYNAATAYADGKARKAYVSGVLKPGAFIYSSKATTNNSGVVTFYLTSDGTAQGTAVYSNVYADSISVAVYGSTANYQPYSPAVANDNKSVTITINQATSVLLGAIQLVSAAAGIDCRLYVLGD